MKNVLLVQLIAQWRTGCQHFQQEPTTRSLQVSHVPVTAFSQTDLFY